MLQVMANRRRRERWRRKRMESSPMRDERREGDDGRGGIGLIRGERRANAERHG